MTGDESQRVEKGMNWGLGGGEGDYFFSSFFFAPVVAAELIRWSERSCMKMKKEKGRRLTGGGTWCCRNSRK